MRDIDLQERTPDEVRKSTRKESERVRWGKRKRHGGGREESVWCGEREKERQGGRDRERAVKTRRGLTTHFQSFR